MASVPRHTSASNRVESPVPDAHGPASATGGAAARVHDIADPRMHGVPPEGLAAMAPAPPPADDATPAHAALECGWGRLLFGPAFESPAQIARALMDERPGRRDIALYVDSPQLVLAEAPTDLFLDPSLMFRRALDPETPDPEMPPGVFVRPLATRSDIAAINRLYRSRGMVPLDPAVVWRLRGGDGVLYVVAEDERTGEVIGSAMGIDHGVAFGDRAGGSSLWCLVVDPQTSLSGVGQALTLHLIAHFASRGRTFLDLSVLHDNRTAIGLYRKLGFEEVTGFVVKRRNVINQRLFLGASDLNALNPYARIIVDEAQRRGIGVEVLDAQAGIFKLRHGGQEIACRESLSDLTGGVAMTWCQDKVLTSRRLASVGLPVPRQRTATSVPGQVPDDADCGFLRECGAVVVKPAFGEQGRGISMDVRGVGDLEAAISRAAAVGGPVVIEQLCEGHDLRIVVIGYRVVAAAMRRPAQVIGDGTSSVAQLIERQSARRAAATGGESRIPVDAETLRCIASQQLDLEAVPESGRVVPVRRTANLHTGGTIHDVTDVLHPTLRDAAEQAARALRIPVVGLDFLTPAPDVGSGWVIIEANERPGLANHEPQPTAQRFVDLLFPFTA
jgi:GNAT-family acetyltransferase (TIGR03103 family)